jgi:branched-chain amino acid transport system ATP-binding protein
MPILECQKVSKAYGGLLAVSDLSFAVEPGEVYAIVGPNGAGKTSLFDCISGVNPATSGVIKFKDREIQGLRAHQISRLGLARTFQTTVAFDTQTVLTNVLVGGAFGRDGENPTLSFKNQAQDDALDALALCGLGNQQRKLAGALPVLARKRLMLATALAMRPQMLLLDEPFGGLNPSERGQMIDLIRVVAKTGNESGVTILMIEHVMKAVQALADRILVIHHGQQIAVGPPSTVLRDRRVIEVYLGNLVPMGPEEAAPTDA